MSDRCSECGFSPEDYRGRFDVPWVAAGLKERAALSFEGLPKASVVGGCRSPGELAEKLGDLAASDLHEAVHACSAAAREAALLALGPAFRNEGRVEQVNSSAGGVPKLPLPLAQVGWRGVEGDRHREPKHHGHAWQGLCLWSSEVIGALVAEGHPIAPGYAGENLTLSGLDWARVRTGLRLAVGDELFCEVTGPAVPCKKNKEWFLGGDFRRMSHSLHPGWSRWYAAVIAPGRVRPGDRVRTELGAAPGSVSPSGGRPSRARGAG